MDIEQLAALDDVPDAVLNHPSMMSIDQKAALYHLARDHYQGWGEIIDAGLFLGASTAALVEGLRTSAAPIRRTIHSYEIAIWVKSMDKHLDNPAVSKAISGSPVPQDGESYEDLLLRILEPYRELAEIHIGDVCETLQPNGPIEIAFYDCLKTDAIDRGVYRRAAAHYARGTIIVHQDFFHDRAPDHKVRQEVLADHFDYLGQVGSCAVFRMTKPFTEEQLANDPVDQLSFDDKSSLLRRAAERATTALSKGFVLTSLVEFELAAKRRPQALAAIEEASAVVPYLSPKKAPRFTERLEALRRKAT